VLAIRTPVETFVVVTFVKADNPDALIVPVVSPVLAIRTPVETFVVVTFVKADNPDALRVPAISTVDAGTVVLIPTFPFVKYKLEFIRERDIDAALFINMIY